MAGALGFDPKSIPLFPPWCIVPLEIEHCDFFGLKVPCAKAVDLESTLFGQETFFGHWFTTFMLLTIGVINVSYAKWPYTYADSMKLATGYYAIITALFALCRVYLGISRFLLAGAAIHNLSEWIYLSHIRLNNDTEEKNQKYFRRAALFIFTVVVLVMMLPSLPLAAIAEQSTGIMIDYGLVLVYNYQWLFGPDKEAKDFFFYPAFAHTIHLFFTILPLVFGNFHIGQLSWYNSFYLETAIYISAPATHVLYMLWSFEVDNKKNAAVGKDGKPTGVLPDKFRVKEKTILIILVISWLLGMGTLVGIPLALGPCPATPACQPSSVLTGSVTATVHPGFSDAFTQYITDSNLVAKAHAFPGNKGYELYKDAQVPDTFRFVESWDSMESLTSWISTVGAPTFATPTAKTLLVGGALNVPSLYTKTVSADCTTTHVGGVFIQVASSCDAVWTVISDWGNCDWVIGCKYAVVNGTTRVLHFDNGNLVEVVQRKINHYTKELIYEIVGGTNVVVGYEGHVKVGQVASESGCNLSYNFQVPKTVPASVVYDDFLNVRVPGLQKLFNN